MAKALLGGLLKGAGQGMVDQAEQRRQDALERARELRRQREREEDRDFTRERDDLGHSRTLERDELGHSRALERDEMGHGRALERDELGHGRTLERDEAQDTRRRGLLSTTVTGEDGNLYGITSGGEAVNTGVRPAPVAGRSGRAGSGDGDLEGSGITMSAEEKRLYDEVKGRYTNPNTNQIDWQEFINHLRSMPQERGAQRWNEIADHLTGSIGTNMSESEARAQATREAQQRMSVFRSRSGEFPETDGDVERWTENRIRELVGSGEGAARPAPGGQEAGSGSGTREDPYQPTTKEQFDALPSGAIYKNPADGNLYRKN